MDATDRSTESDQIMSTDQTIQWVDTVGITKEAPQASPCNILSGVDPYISQSEMSRLTRPYILNSFNWDTTQVPGLCYGNYSFPEDLFSAADNLCNIACKYMYFRSGMKFRFRVNGTRFHYGQAIICWIPAYGTIDYPLDNIVAMTAYPHVLISPSTNEVKELTVPYMSEYSAWNLNFPLRGVFGGLFFAVLNPLSYAESGAVPSVQISVAASFDQPKLWGLNYTSNATFVAGIPPHIASNPALNAISLTVFNAASTIMPQASKRAQGKKPSTENIQKSEKGIIGSIAETVQNVAGRLHDIPIIGEIATIVSPIAKIVGSIADFFGWDKPTSLVSVQPIRSIIWQDGPGGSGLDQSTKLALDPSNAVTTSSELVGSYTDDMAILSVAMTPALLSVISWTTSNLAGAPFANLPVSPHVRSWNVSNANNAFNLLWMSTPLAHVAYPFRWWRGSIKYHLRIVASQFHTGRFMIRFMPFTPSPYTFNFGDNMEMVVDLNGESEISFTVPFMWDRVWAEGCIGYLQFSTINNVLVPGGATSSSVYINVFAAAGEDFQVAQPIPRYAVAKYELTDNTTAPPPVAPSVVTQPQSAVRTKFRDETFPAFHGMAKYSIDTGVCMGEAVTSVRTLLHRYSCIFKGPLLANSAALGAITSNATVINAAAQLNAVPGKQYPGDALIYSSFCPTPFWDASVVTQGCDPLLNYNHFFHMRQIYRFFRGSLRYRVLCEPSPNYFAFIRNTPPPPFPTNQTDFYVGLGPPTAAVLTQATVSPTNMMAGGAMLVRPGYAPMIEVEVPYYSNMQSGVLNNLNLTPPLYDRLDNTIPSLMIAVDPIFLSGPAQAADLPFGTWTVLMAVGDDFTMGYIQGMNMQYLVDLRGQVGGTDQTTVIPFQPTVAVVQNGFLQHAEEIVSSTY